MSSDQSPYIPPTDVDTFNEYMLAQLQAVNEYLELLRTRSDQSIQQYITIGSAASGLFVLALTQNQPIHVLLGILSLIAFTVGVVGLGTLLRYARLRFESDSQIAIRNHIHRYFRSRHPEFFQEYKCEFNLVSFETSTWKRSLSDRPFLIAIGIGNVMVFTSAIPLALIALISGFTSLPLNANLWWIILITLSMGTIASVLTYRTLKRQFLKSEDFIARVGPPRA